MPQKNVSVVSLYNDNLYLCIFHVGIIHNSRYDSINESTKIGIPRIISTLPFHLNKRQRIPKGQSQFDNSEKLAT